MNSTRIIKLEGNSTEPITNFDKGSNTHPKKFREYVVIGDKDKDGGLDGLKPIKHKFEPMNAVANSPHEAPLGYINRSKEEIEASAELNNAEIEFQDLRFTLHDSSKAMEGLNRRAQSTIALQSNLHNLLRVHVTQSSCNQLLHTAIPTAGSEHVNPSIITALQDIRNDALDLLDRSKTFHGLLILLQEAHLRHQSQLDGFLQSLSAFIDSRPLFSHKALRVARLSNTSKRNPEVVKDLTRTAMEKRNREIKAALVVQESILFGLAGKQAATRKRKPEIRNQETIRERNKVVGNFQDPSMRVEVLFRDQKIGVEVELETRESVASKESTLELQDPFAHTCTEKSRGGATTALAGGPQGKGGVEIEVKLRKV